MAAGPITLTRAQFAQTPVGQKPGASYGNYRAYIAAHRGANATPPAPTPPAGGGGVPGLNLWTQPQINQITARILGQFGTPRSAAQIQQSATDQISPIIAAVTKTANDRAAAASAAIKGLTDSYATQLSQTNYAAPYQQAEQGQAAVDSALQQSLAGQGSDLAAGLSQRLGAVNDPSTATAAAGLSSRGAALGTSQLATGSSALSALIANAAAAKEYGAKQPGIADLAGIQGVRQAQAQAGTEISTGTNAALAQLPQIVQALQASNATLRGNRAQATASLFGTLTGQNITKASINAGLQGTIAKANASTTNAATRAAAAAGKISPTWSKINKVVSDQNGNPILRNGQTIPYKGSGAGSSGKPLTVDEAKGAAASANTIAVQGFKGAPAVTRTNANGTTTIVQPALPKLTRVQAIEEMRQEGLFADPRTARIALNAVNRVYGKPLTPAQQKAQNQAVASGLGLPQLPGWAKGLPTAPTNPANPGSYKK